MEWPLAAEEAFGGSLQRESWEMKFGVNWRESGAKGRRRRMILLSSSGKSNLTWLLLQKMAEELQMHLGARRRAMAQLRLARAMVNPSAACCCTQFLKFTPSSSRCHGNLFSQQEVVKRASHLLSAAGFNRSSLSESGASPASLVGNHSCKFKFQNISTQFNPSHNCNLHLDCKLYSNWSSSSF